MARAGSAAQSSYRPFANPHRVRSEELGDLVAEGLYRLVHEGGDTGAATAAFWRDAVDRRAGFLDLLARRLLAMDPAPGRTQRCAR